MTADGDNTVGWGRPGTPFGYYLERDAGVLVVRRPDGSAAAAFGVGEADPFEVEATIWEDAD
jgi:hypothetical protein